MVAHITLARTLLVLCVVTLVSAAAAAPPSRDVYDRHVQAVKELKEAVAGEPDDERKFGLVSESLAKESNVDFRRRILEFAATIPSPELEAFMLNRLSSEDDAGLRSLAATTLGKSGSEHCLGTLANVAATDPTTTWMMGCCQLQSSARRAATFAIAELADRFPQLTDSAAAALRSLPDTPDPKDNQSLADARRQALYQVTRDESLLHPYFEGLKSSDPADRRDAVIAFRFLKLKQAPPELARALQDADERIAACTAMVLGEIRDPESVEPLMAIAQDASRARSIRSNSIGALGRMRAKGAANLMEKLLADPEEVISTNAAVALYRITGKKTKQFPEGYSAD